jgi:phosphohistidine swiveling domain-containing protein
LKDGDYIEVDANNGIVKILSSKGYKKVNESREPELNIDDFTFTFESQGTSFIFENIIIDHYMPSGESITMWKDGKKRVLIHKSVMDKMDKQGLTRTPKDTEDAIKRLKGTVDCMNDERSGYNQKPKLTLDDVKHMFSILRDLCQQYLYFDCTYWDSTYKKSEHDASAKKNIKLVENFKNEIRDRLNIAYFGPKSYLSILLKNMCKQFSISFKDIEWYAESEIIDLFNSMKVPVTELKARRISYLYHIDNNSHIKLYSGDAAATLISRFDKPFERTSNIIKGKTANNTGIKVKAPVKIIRRDYSNESITRQNIAKMHKGDILVSETTDPTLMEAFRKASAVITDVGGMLSHAAITARELNLPCIVDTKSATKILHDGDLVEVDADKGIVKIIK